MGAYAYCEGCDIGLDPPTLSDLQYGWVCTNCKLVNRLPDEPLNIVIEIFDERIEELEREVRRLKGEHP